MTLASKITLVRVAMIPAFMVTMYLSGGTPGLWMYVSLAIFIVASLTDSLDCLLYTSPSPRDTR